jgi:hypothetical protein
MTQAFCAERRSRDGVCCMSERRAHQAAIERRR